MDIHLDVYPFKPNVSPNLLHQMHPNGRAQSVFPLSITGPQEDYQVSLETSHCITRSYSPAQGKAGYMEKVQKRVWNYCTPTVFQALFYILGFTVLLNCNCYLYYGCWN